MLEVTETSLIRQVDANVDKLQALRALGVREGTRVGLLARNHSGFVQTMAACGRLGADTVLLNTCNLDHPQALANYLARGFREIRVEKKTKEIPGAPPGPWEGANEINAARELLRHTIAVVAYRGAKALRGAPPSFADFKPGPTSRTPLQILAHICDLYDWSITLAYAEPKWNDSTPGTWQSESDRFFAALQTLDDCLTGDFCKDLRACEFP